MTVAIFPQNICINFSQVKSTTFYVLKRHRILRIFLLKNQIICLFFHVVVQREDASSETSAKNVGES